MQTGKINEIFYSMQGEGIYLGVPQVFIRFSGCNIHCVYCDADHLSYKTYTTGKLLEEVETLLGDKSINSISITGGEPLCQKDFLIDYLPLLRRRGYKVYLETNGILYDELRQVLFCVDIISMDFKLPSSTMGRSFWEEHEEFLKIGLEKEIFVKIVVTQDTSLKDINTAVEIMSGVNPKIPLIIQPVTENSKCKSPEAGKIEDFKNLALKKIYRVEVIPQIHPLLGIR